MTLRMTTCTLSSSLKLSSDLTVLIHLDVEALSEDDLILEAKTLNLLAEVMNALLGARGNRKASLGAKDKSSRMKSSSPGPDSGQSRQQRSTPEPGATG